MIVLLNMTEKTERFLRKWLPDVVNAKKVNDILDPLYMLIEVKGFDENEEYNTFGKEAQEVYDDIYYSNQ